MRVLIVFLLTICVPALSFCDEKKNDPTPKERIALLPLPEGVEIAEDADFSKDPMLAFSQKHRDFSMLDPFQMERRKGEMPDVDAICYTTPMSARDVYLFYKSHFGRLSLMRGKDRPKRLYNSTSQFEFDQKGDGDVSNDKALKDEVFYRTSMRGGKRDGPSRRLEIVIFDSGPDEDTTVYLFAYDVPPKA